MVRIQASGGAFPARPRPRFDPELEPSEAFPVQVVRIDWERLLAKRPTVLETVDAMPAYLLKPKVLGLPP